MPRCGCRLTRLVLYRFRVSLGRCSRLGIASLGCITLAIAALWCVGWSIAALGRICRSIAALGRIARSVATLGCVGRSVATLGRIARSVAPLGCVALGIAALGRIALTIATLGRIALTIATLGCVALAISTLGRIALAISTLGCVALAISTLGCVAVGVAAIMLILLSRRHGRSKFDLIDDKNQIAPLIAVLILIAVFIYSATKVDSGTTMNIHGHDPIDRFSVGNAGHIDPAPIVLGLLIIHSVAHLEPCKRMIGIVVNARGLLIPVAHDTISHKISEHIQFSSRYYAWFH